MQEGFAGLELQDGLGLVDKEVFLQEQLAQTGGGRHHLAGQVLGGTVPHLEQQLLQHGQHLLRLHLQVGLEQELQHEEQVVHVVRLVLHQQLVKLLHHIPVDQ